MSGKMMEDENFLNLLDAESLLDVFGDTAFFRRLNRAFDLQSFKENEIKILVLPIFQREYCISLCPGYADIALSVYHLRAWHEQFNQDLLEAPSWGTEFGEDPGLKSLHSDAIELVEEARPYQDHRIVLDGVRYFFSTWDSRVGFCHSPNKSSRPSQFLDRMHELLKIPYQDNEGKWRNLKN